jgi:hypothetical protein
LFLDLKHLYTMAKSLRAKSKVAARRKKRTDSHYAVADAERMARVHANLTGKGKAQEGGKAAAEDKEDEAEEEAVEGGMAVDGEDAPGALPRSVLVARSSADDISPRPDHSLLTRARTAPAKKISTSGARDTRREQWRESKGLPIRPKSKGLNNQGGAAAKRKAGRPGRRR